MNIDGVPHRTIWPGEDGASVAVIDQTRLPHEFVTRRLATLAEALAVQEVVEAILAD